MFRIMITAQSTNKIIKEDCIMYPRNNRNNLYLHSSQMLSKGFMHQKSISIAKLALMRHDFKAMAILHASIIADDNDHSRIIHSLSKFLLPENVYFLTTLFNTSNKYAVAYRTLIRLKERLVGLLNRSLSDESKILLMNEPDNDRLISLYFSHPKWNLYRLVSCTLGLDNTSLAPFRLYGEELRYRLANIDLRNLIKDRNQDGMIKILPTTKGQVTRDAISYLSDKGNLQLSNTITQMKNERGPNWFITIEDLL